jgi:hypothetical protein
MPNKIPYLTKKHLIVLADELAEDKIFYNSMIAWHEKYKRLTDYCNSANDRFDIKTFNKRIKSTYEHRCNKLDVKPELLRFADA